MRFNINLDSRFDKEIDQIARYLTKRNKAKYPDRLWNGSQANRSYVIQCLIENAAQESDPPKAPKFTPVKK